MVLQHCFLYFSLLIFVSEDFLQEYFILSMLPHQFPHALPHNSQIRDLFVNYCEYIFTVYVHYIYIYV